MCYTDEKFDVLQKEEQMQKHKMNWRFWFFTGLFGLISAMAVYVIALLLRGGVSDENGNVIGGAFRFIMVFLFSLVALTYLFSFFTMLRQYFFFVGSAFEITANGIENTMTFVCLGAFIFVFPVRRIPWHAITTCMVDEGIYIRMKRRDI